MTDLPGGSEPPPRPDLPPPPGAYPPPSGARPQDAYPPPYQPPYQPAYQPPYQSGYQQQGYGWSQGGGYASYAGFWIRFAAALIDGLILAIPMAVVALLVDPNGFNVNVSVGASPRQDPLVNLLSTLLGVAYYGLLEGGVTGQTLGKKAMGIRVVDADTFAPGIGTGRGIGRYFARYLSAFACLVGYLWMLWDPRKQTWHDKLVRTCVVRT